jgi:N-acetylglucosaminyl-diphospho-decaprenol L-rhamnosyltransferase
MAPEPQPPRTKADLTLSIVSHGHGPLVHRLLGDLNSLPSLQGARVLLTLNIPEDLGSLGDYGHLHIEVLVNEKPRGFGENHNQAFARCRTGLFVVLNPDLRILQDPFPALAGALAADAGIALVAPLVANSTGQVEDSVRNNLTPWSLVARRVGLEPARGKDLAASRGFYWLAGMFMLFRAEAYRAIGGFDTRFFLYCEDYDICVRLRLSGRTIMLVPGVQVVHDAQRDSHRSFRHLRWHLSSLFKVWTSPAFWRWTLHRMLESSH